MSFFCDVSRFFFLDSFLRVKVSRNEKEPFKFG